MSVAQRAAVKLDKINNETLVIGEGVETALAVRELMAMNHIERMPVWAVGSCGAISFFPLIDGVRKLFVLGENNDGDANKRAADLCRTRWRKDRRKVIVIQPRHPLSDMNDALMAEKTEKKAAS
jgi:putative DNA primase/helicase